MEVIVAEGRGLSSRLIKFFTKSKWTHVALRYSHPDQDWLVHATVGGVQPEWWWYFSSKKYVSYRRYRVKFPLADQALDNVVKRTAHHPYDYFSFVGFGLYILFNWVSHHLLGNPAMKANPFGIMDRFMCTEMVTEWQDECNKLNPSLNLKQFDSELTAPNNLVDFWDSRPELFEFIPEE